MEQVKEAISKIPPVTRYYMGITLLLSFCMTYQIVSPYAVILDFNLVCKGEIWRLLTAYFFAGSFSMNFLFTMLMIYYTFTSAERHYQGKDAEFATMLLFNVVATMFYGWLANEYMILQSPFCFAIMYVWSKLVPDAQISIWGFPVQSCNLPWVMIALHIFTGGNIISDLVGVGSGHTYYYLKKVLPDSHGYDLVKTPNWI